MHIVTASDENYVPGVLVLIASAARHNPQVRFTILATRWSDQSRAKLASLTERLKIRADICEITAERLAVLPVTRSHLTASAYARLFIPELLPDDKRVIYMDCDMIATGSLAEAWECDLTGKVLAAVRCPGPTKAFAAAINLPLESYFNSGFLVLNLELWRAEETAKLCFKRLVAPDSPYLSEDESALNDVARNRVLYLPSGFNFYASNTSFQAALTSPPSIRVIHYITRPKPWAGPAVFGELWLAEVAKIPEMADFKVAPESRHSKFSRLNRLRKAWIGKLLGKPKYRRFRQVRVLIRDSLVPHYLKYGRFPEQGLSRD